MDQVKEFLRQCIKYRFWISLSVAALFAIIAYFVGSRPVQAKADQQTKTITQAANDVKRFASPGIPNDQYKPIVDEKTQVLTKDVNSAWKQLYSRQAPLLSWPETVQQRFREWGRKWPENVAEGAVELAKVDYIEAYPKYVEEVYRVFKPFDYEQGEGIVAAPSKEALLRPLVFDQTKLPELGKIWAGQERLWIQRTVLEVVAQVNKKAKDWDSAIVKQINILEVGNPVAQDQRSIAKGEQLEESEAIKAPGADAEEDVAAPGGGTGGMSVYGSQRETMMRGAMGRGGMGGGGALAGATENIYFVKPENDKGQYKILPIMMSVLIDQDHIQDLLVELENSPMSIQVMDFELQRPSSRVTKPEKGSIASFSGYGESMMGGMMRGAMGGRMGREGSMSGYGGMMSGYGSMMSRMMSGRGGAGMGGYPGMGMGMGMGAAPSRQGTDKRTTDRGKVRKEETKAVETAKGPSLFDPYFDIVEVKVYGQARFYNPPPADAETEPSLGDTAAKAASDNEPAKGDATTAEPAKTEPAKTEPAEAAPAKTGDAKAEPAKSEPGDAKAEPAKTLPAKVVEPAKAEPAKSAGTSPGTPKT
jgi:hypothetical protein